MSSNKTHTSKKGAIPKERKPSKADKASAGKASKPSTYVIDPAQLVDLPQATFDAYVKCLQLVSFSILREDFSGSAQQITRLESQMTLCDIILATQAIAAPSFDMQRFVVHRYKAPTSARAWLDSLESDALALARAIALVNLDSVDVDPTGPEVDKGAQATMDVSPSVMLESLSEDADAASSAKRPRFNEVAQSARPTSGRVPPPPTLGDHLQQAGLTVKSEVHRPSAPQKIAVKPRDYLRRRETRCKAQHNTVALSESRVVARRSCSSRAASMGLPNAMGVGLAEAYCSGDNGSILAGLEPLLAGMECVLVREHEVTPQMHLLENISMWRSLPPGRYYTTDTALHASRLDSRGHTSVADCIQPHSPPAT